MPEESGDNGVGAGSLSNNVVAGVAALAGSCTGVEGRGVSGLLIVDEDEEDDVVSVISSG